MTFIIGVTGRAGSGKSFFQRAVESLSQLTILDLDKVGHDVLKMPETKKNLRDVFGQTPFGDDGEINRKALGTLVFSDPTALEKLNKISHPIIIKMAREFVLTCPTPCCLMIGALIHEIGLAELCDFIVVIDADDSLIKERAPLQYERHRFQASREVFLKRADLVIVNSFDAEFETSSRSIMYAILEEKQQR